MLLSSSNRKYTPFSLSYFSMVVCLRCLLHHILSLTAYTFRKKWEFVFILIVQFMMSANSRIRFNLYPTTLTIETCYLQMCGLFLMRNLWAVFDEMKLGLMVALCHRLDINLTLLHRIDILSIAIWGQHHIGLYHNRTKLYVIYTDFFFRIGVTFSTLSAKLIIV